MSFELKDVSYIIGIVVSATITFLSTRHNLKEYVRDKVEKLSEEITCLKLEMKDLKMKDELQQQVIDQTNKQIDGIVHRLMESFKQKTV